MHPRWREVVVDVLSSIAAGDLRKAVLARRAVRDARSIDSALPLLAALHTTQPHTFRFGLQLRPGVAFFGASPELLYRRRGRAIASEALAGTRRRGRDAHEDARLVDELRGSAKERREHELVREHIQRQLASLCTELHCAAAPELQRLPQVQHLRSRCSGELRADVDDGAVLARLHPTPAVCGVPTDAARARIAACEDFDRGLYSGPIGVLRRDAADCAVAIRSALLSDDELFVYAGAGIVEGSAAQAEWDETANKMRTLDDLLDRPAAAGPLRAPARSRQP
jgi:menaquinone-specific isochorismate synthase